jgi:hypothetical protein
MTLQGGFGGLTQTGTGAALVWYRKYRGYQNRLFLFILMYLRSDQMARWPFSHCHSTK